VCHRSLDVYLAWTCIYLIVIPARFSSFLSHGRGGVGSLGFGQLAGWVGVLMQFAISVMVLDDFPPFCLTGGEEFGSIGKCRLIMWVGGFG